jgi:hypothetical protein
MAVKKQHLTYRNFPPMQVKIPVLRFSIIFSLAAILSLLHAAPFEKDKQSMPGTLQTKRCSSPYTYYHLLVHTR